MTLSHLSEQSFSLLCNGVRRFVLLSQTQNLRMRESSVPRGLLGRSLVVNLVCEKSGHPGSPQDAF